MKWKKRQREIARLRKKHRGARFGSTIPELMPREQAATSYPSLTSSGVCSVTSVKRTLDKTLLSTNIVVGTPHKQGPMVMFRSELPWAGGKKS